MTVREDACVHYAAIVQTFDYPATTKISKIWFWTAHHAVNMHAINAVNVSSYIDKQVMFAW